MGTVTMNCKQGGNRHAHQPAGTSPDGQRLYLCCWCGRTTTNPPEVKLTMTPVEPTLGRLEYVALGEPDDLEVLVVELQVSTEAWERAVGRLSRAVEALACTLRARTEGS